MDEYRRAISEQRRAIEKNTDEIRRLLRKLGEHLSYQDAGDLSSTEMKDLHGRIQDLRRQLPESRQQVKRILQTVSGNRELEREIQSRNLQAAELARKNEEICEAIGRAAYQAYRDLDEPAEEYREMFDPLMKLEGELAEAEAEQTRLQEHGQEGKFFKIFRETGRSLYIKGLLSLRRRAAAKAYHEVGKRFCQSDLKESLGNSALQEVLAPYEANYAKITALQKEIDKLRRDQEKKWSELKKLGAYRSHQKRVREIETDIQRVEEHLEGAFEGLGTLLRKTLSAESQDAEAAGILRQIREIEQTNRRKTKQIERLNAAMGIDYMSRQLGNLESRVAKLEGDIEVRRREIDTLREQISEGEKELQRLQRIRGSKQSLLQEERGNGSN
jgi:chromosome segregation ATPase